MVDHEEQPDTSWDEQIDHELFMEFIREALRIPGGGGLFLISDSEEEEETFPMLHFQMLFLSRQGVLKMPASQQMKKMTKKKRWASRIMSVGMTLNLRPLTHRKSLEGGCERRCSWRR
jgi:hypothetical protein